MERIDLLTGEKREIYRGKPGEFIYGASLSPDEKIFAFISMKRDMERTKRYILIPESGGQEIASFRYYFPEGTELFSWAPKSKGGLVGLKRSADLEKVELWYYPPGETTVSRKLEFVDQSARIMFSPDGKYVAYTAELESESKFWAIENCLPPKK